MRRYSTVPYLPVVYIYGYLYIAQLIIIPLRFAFASHAFGFRNARDALLRYRLCKRARYDAGQE